MLITCSSKQISPPSTVLKPAIMRSRVVLPQPEGPKRVKNSPCSMFRLMPLTAVKSPYFLTAFLMITAWLIVDNSSSEYWF